MPTPIKNPWLLRDPDGTEISRHVTIERAKIAAKSDHRWAPDVRWERLSDTLSVARHMLPGQPAQDDVLHIAYDPEPEPENILHTDFKKKFGL